ncbi:MAG: hypothetical protein K9L30_05575 [Desulfobacterales bacterium]|nr:hypothetical protein [Desulfobacterales bacterium]
MNVFYGAAIQGNEDREKRQFIHRGIIQHIKNLGLSVATEHTTGSSKTEAASLLAESIGKLPSAGIERTRFVRRKMIELVESDISACVFEVSVPSLGTGIEIAHAYLRPRMGLPKIPILALYEKDYWSQNLSSMIRGLSTDDYPNFIIKEYSDLTEAYEKMDMFFKKTGLIK